MSFIGWLISGNWVAVRQYAHERTINYIDGERFTSTYFFFFSLQRKHAKSLQSKRILSFGVSQSA